MFTHQARNIVMFIPELKSLPNEDICILIKLDNHTPYYICECGDASLLSVKDAQNAQAIFISHTHIDHFVNFDTILRHQLGIEKKVVICGPEGIARQVQSKIRAYTWNLIEAGSIVYEIREIISKQEINIYKIEPPKWKLREIGVARKNTIFGNERFQVNFTLLNHKIPSVAYLFREIDTVKIDLSKGNFKGGAWVRELKMAFEQKMSDNQIIVDGKNYTAKDLFHLLDIKKGNTLGIIMDHAPSPENQAKIKALFSDCDKVFIESFYKLEDKAFAEANYHSYSQASGRVMRECGVQEAVPVHFSRKYKEDDIRQLTEEFKQAYEG